MQGWYLHIDTVDRKSTSQLKQYQIYIYSSTLVIWEGGMLKLCHHMFIHDMILCTTEQYHGHIRGGENKQYQCPPLWSLYRIWASKSRQGLVRHRCASGNIITPLPRRIPGKYRGTFILNYCVRIPQSSNVLKMPQHENNICNPIRFLHHVSVNVCRQHGSYIKGTNQGDPREDGSRKLPGTGGRMSGGIEIHQGIFECRDMFLVPNFIQVRWWAANIATLQGQDRGRGIH